MSSVSDSGLAFVAPGESRLSRIAFALLWLVVFSVPWEKSVMVAGFGSVSRLIGAVAFVAGLITVVARRVITRPLPAHILLAVFVLWTGLTYWWTLSPSVTQAAGLTCLRLPGMTWLVWEVAPQEQHRISLMQAYIAGTLVAAGQTIGNFLSHQYALGGTFSERYAPSGFNPNDLGLTVALSIPLSYYLAIHSSGVRAWFYRMQILLCVITIGLTASRSAFVAGSVALLIVPLTLRWHTIAHKLCTAIIITLALAVVLVLPVPSLERLSTTKSEITEGTLNTRTEIWRAGVEVFCSHPIVGVGAGAYPAAVEPIIGVPHITKEEWSLVGDVDVEPQNVAHNTFLSVLVETGIIGFIFFCSALLSVASAVMRMEGFERRLWVTMAAVWLTAASVSTWENRKPTWVLFSLVLIPSTTLQCRRCAHPCVCTPIVTPS